MDKDVVHTYNGILLSCKKKKKRESKIMSFAAIWMDVVISHWEVNQTKKDKYHTNLLHVESKKKDTNEPIYKREIVANVERKLMTTRGCWERINWKIGNDIYMDSVAQLCPTLCNPMDHSLPGSSLLWIFQARILKWVVISYSRDIYVLLYRKYLTNKDLLESTGNSAQYSIMAYMGK